MKLLLSTDLFNSVNTIKLSLVLHLLWTLCLFNLANKWSLQIHFVWPYKHLVNGSRLRMMIIHVTKENSGLSQAERGEMIGESIKCNNQGDAISRM